MIFYSLVLACCEKSMHCSQRITGFSWVATLFEKNKMQHVTWNSLHNLDKWSLVVASILTFLLSRNLEWIVTFHLSLKKSVRIWRNPQYKDTHARHKYGLQDISLVPQHVQNLMFDVHGPDPPRSHTMLKDGASQCNNFFATLLCWNCNWRKSQVSY